MNAVADIKARHSITSVLASHGVEVKGGMARCPFHDDQNPSLSVKDGKWKCWAGCGHGDVIDLLAMFEGKTSAEYLRNGSGTTTAVESKRPISNPRASRVDLLGRIKADYPFSMAEQWESSPIRCDSRLDDTAEFLKLFPADAILWIAPSVTFSGEKYAWHFRRRRDWQGQVIAAPGTRIAPCSFKPGGVNRSRENVEQQHFVVVESDEIGDGKKYADHDEFCSLIRWLREACQWHLAAVVDSGGKSLHAWFRYPGLAEVSQLADHKTELGLDGKLMEPSQPWRLPGVRRENSERRQQLFYLDLKEAV